MNINTKVVKIKTVTIEMTDHEASLLEQCIEHGITTYAVAQGPDVARFFVDMVKSLQSAQQTLDEDDT